MRFLRLLLALVLLSAWLPAQAQVIRHAPYPGFKSGFQYLSGQSLSLISSVYATYPTGASGTTGCFAGTYITASPTIPNPDGGSPALLPVVDSGYSTSGAVTTYSHNLIITKLMRQVYPNQGTPTTQDVSLSDYVYPTTTISGVSTTGCDRAPTPVANWGTPHRQVINASITGLEVLAFSRDAQQGSEVAAVGCTATDGSLTSPQAVASAMSVSGRPDVNPVVDYAIPAIDTSTLAAGLITVNCKVYPWYGGSASINDSSTVSVSVANLRLFSPRYFWKTAAAPFNVFICQQTVALSCPAAGVDATCVVSTTFATANAAPCLTFQGAMNKLKTNGAVDNAIIYVSSNTGTPFALAGPSTTSMTQNAGCLIVTRDPQVTRANAVLSFGNSVGPTITSVTNPTGTGCIRFTDMTMKRTQGNTILGNATNPLEIIWDQVNLDDGTFTGTWFNAARADDYIFDATISNPGANFLGTAASGNHRIIRGVSITTPGTIELNTIVGSTLTPFGNSAPPSGATNDGTILAFNQLLKITISAAAGINSAVPNGLAYVQNVWEETSATTSNTLFTASNDSATNSTNNVILQYNTVLGAFQAGRSNLFYDDGATERINKLESLKGNLLGQINTKGDVFVTDGTRVGNWGVLYGAGTPGNLSQYIDANNGGLGTSFAQAYGGLGSLIGTSNKTAQMAVTLFTNYQAVTCVTPGTSCATNVAGAGNGTYSVTTGTPLKIVSSAMLSADLAGTTRLLTGDSAGAYVAP